MKSFLHIIADAHIRGVASAFSSLPDMDVNLRILEHEDICREALKDADVLLTRSSTLVNADLLEGTHVRFVATATIGDDHFDKTWLADHGIAFANAAGSSTGSVIEYMTTVLLSLHARGLIAIPRTTIGMIGAGRIGSALVKICEAMGMRVLINDPPRARSEGNTDFCSLDEVLQRADVLTLHTPLLRDGEDCTVHLLDATRLSCFRGAGVINAGRGSCVDNAALADWLDSDTGRFAVLDCWEHEPTPMHRLLTHPQLAIHTPHIAGHSLDGKAANTQYAYHALCRWLGIKPEWNMRDELPSPCEPMKIICTGELWLDLFNVATRLYPLRTDHEAMRAWEKLSASELANAFTRYRRHYPARRAWEHSPVHFAGRHRAASQQLKELAQALGMKIV